MSSSTCARRSRIRRRTRSLRSSTFMPRTRPRASRSRRFAPSSLMCRSPSTARPQPRSAPWNASATKSGPSSTRWSTVSRCNGRSATAASAPLWRGPWLQRRGSRDDLLAAAVGRPAGPCRRRPGWRLLPPEHGLPGDESGRAVLPLPTLRSGPGAAGRARLDRSDTAQDIAAKPHFLRRRSVQATEQLQHDLEQDQQHDGQLQKPHAPVARHVEHELQGLAHALQLLLHRGVAIDQIEFGAQLVVDPVHLRVVPGRVGLVEQGKHGEDLVAGGDGLADEPVQPANARGYRAVLLQRFDETDGPREQPLDDPLVILERGALCDDQRHHGSAPVAELVDDEIPVDDVHPPSRLLADREAFPHHLPGQTGPRAAQAGELRLAPVGRHVVEDDGAERVDEDLLVVADGNAHLAQPKPGIRIGCGELAQREVLLEGDGGELVRAGSHPRSSTPCANDQPRGGVEFVAFWSSFSCRSSRLRNESLPSTNCRPRPFSTHGVCVCPAVTRWITLACTPSGAALSGSSSRTATSEPTGTSCSVCTYKPLVLMFRAQAAITLPSLPMVTGNDVGYRGAAR